MSDVNTKREPFTATEIARAIGCSRQNVHLQLTDIPHVLKVVRGGRAKAWTHDLLPEPIRCQLSEKVEAKKYRSIPHLLSEPFERFEAPVPWREMAPEAISRAHRLCNAFQGILALRNDLSISASEFTRRGLASYKQAVGHEVSAKHWRMLLDRTVRRDNGAEEWHRLELYLEENPARVSRNLARALARESGLELLEDLLESFKGRATLTPEERESLWTKSCDELKQLVETAAEPDKAGRITEKALRVAEKARRVATKKAKRKLLPVLLKTGFVGSDFHSIRRTFDRKWKQYRATGGKRLTDRRTLRRKESLPEEDKDLIAAKILDYDGCVQQGWQAARSSGELSDATEARSAENCDRIPNSVRREVTPFARSLMSLHKGERAFRQSGPYVQGEYSNLFAGEVHEMDDGTPEHVCYAPSTDFPGYRILQGQIIVTVDRASGRALGFGYVEDAYHGRVIRSTETKACTDFGLCKRLNIERGLWAKAKLIVGRKTGIVSLDEWEMGLREYMRITHARGPQGKAIVERFFGSLWDRLRPVPGYCGPDMRKTCPELLQRQIREARAGKIAPATFCLSKKQFIDAIAEAMADYNATPQNGRLKGRSPNQAWDERQPPDGLTEVTEAIAYLMAYHREPHIIKRRQIVKSIGGDDYVYHSAVTAKLDRHRVLLWRHPDDLSCVHVTSLDRKEGPYTIPLIKCCSHKAEPDYEAIQRAQAVVDETNAAKRAEYRSIKPYLAKTRFRATLADRPTVSLGESIAVGAAATKREQSESFRTLRRAQRVAREQGINAPIDTKTALAVTESGRLLKEVFGPAGIGRADEQSESEQ
jgi:hypothetical protein